MTQLDLHLPPPAPDFTRATRQRDAALARCETVTSDAFREAAADCIVSTLRARGPSSGESLVLACKAAGLVPSDDRHFGCVFRRLSMRGLIRCVGYVPRSRGHNTAGGRLWALS